MAKDETFLSRWSRLKQGERKGEVAPVRKEEASTPNAAEEKKDETLELPSVESLTKDSDFSVFMKAGVPDALRNRALRKLWETDPPLYAHDGLTDYGADYAKIMKDGESRAETAYKIGRGFLEKGDLPWEKEEENEKEKTDATAAKTEPPVLPSPRQAETEAVSDPGDRTASKVEVGKDEDIGSSKNQEKRTEKLG
jgi:hypothetical protein